MGRWSWTRRLFSGFQERRCEAGRRSVISESRSRDVEGSSWPLRIVLFVSAIALVAETGPPSYKYPFEKTVAGPETALTADTPYVRYRVRVEATGLAPNGRATTSSASVAVKGTISTTDIDEAPFVAVGVSQDGVTPQTELSAVTVFELGAHLPFEGSCEKPSAAPPCSSTFYVDFARDDGGERGGSANVSFTLVFASEAEKDEEPNAPMSEPPWTVEIVRE